MHKQTLMLNLKNRLYPKSGVFCHNVKNNYFTFLEYKDDFLYYENTVLEQVLFDDRHSIPWEFFSIDGLNYFLPRILFLIQEEIDDLPISLSDFIVNMTMNARIVEVIEILPKDEVSILIKIVENILYKSYDDIVNSIGEHYLFLALDFLAKIESN